MNTHRHLIMVLVFLLTPSTADAGEPLTLAGRANSAFSVASLVTHKEALDRPHDVELRGDLAFVPGKGGSLAIIDVSDPNSPEIVWHRRHPQELDDAETVLPLGDGRLFLGTNDYHSIDITDPRKPIFQKNTRSEFSGDRSETAGHSRRMRDKWS